MSRVGVPVYDAYDRELWPVPIEDEWKREGFRISVFYYEDELTFVRDHLYYRQGMTCLFGSTHMDSNGHETGEIEGVHITRGRPLLDNSDCPTYNYETGEIEVVPGTEENGFYFYQLNSSSLVRHDDGYLPDIDSLGGLAGYDEEGYLFFRTYDAAVSFVDYDLDEKVFPQTQLKYDVGCPYSETWGGLTRGADLDAYLARRYAIVPAMQAACGGYVIEPFTAWCEADILLCIALPRETGALVAYIGDGNTLNPYKLADDYFRQGGALLGPSKVGVRLYEVTVEAEDDPSCSASSEYVVAEERVEEAIDELIRRIQRNRRTPKK
jgi:hypothetical protein